MTRTFLYYALGVLFGAFCLACAVVVRVDGHPWESLGLLALGIVTTVANLVGVLGEWDKRRDAETEKR